MKRAVMVMALAALLAGPVMGAQFVPLSVPEMTAIGATHVAIFKHSDFTQSVTNENQSFSNVVTVAANDSLELVAMVLKTAFVIGTTNDTETLGLTIGDTNDLDRFLTETELASDSTEVWLKLGRTGADNATSIGALTNVALTTTSGYLTNALITPLSANITYLDGGTNSVTIAVVTNISLTQAAGAAVATARSQTAVNAPLAAAEGRKVYLAADNIIFTFNPGSKEALDDYRAGEVHVYFKRIRPSER